MVASSETFHPKVDAPKTIDTPKYPKSHFRLGIVSLACAPSNEIGLRPVSVGKAKVLAPMIKLPPGSKLMDVPEIVNPRPPAKMVVPSIDNAIGFAVNTCPSTVMISAGVIVAVPNALVFVPMTAAVPASS